MLRFCCRVVAAATLCAVALIPTRATGSEPAPLTLQEAIGRALQFAPSIAATAAQSDFDSAKVREARAPLYPSFSANAEYMGVSGYDQTISNGGLSQGLLVMDYVAYDGGRRMAQVRAARYAAEASALGVRAAQAQIVFDTTVAYYDLLRAREDQHELRTSLDRLTSNVAIVEALERSGRAIANDVLKIRTTRDSAELALASARQAVAHASIVLGSLIGTFGETDLRVAPVSGVASPPNGEVTQSPALMAAERQVNAAALTVTAAQAERYPTLKFQLTTGYQGVYLRQTIRRFGGGSYDGAISVPIFQGGLVASHIDEAKAQQHIATAQVRRVELQLKRDLADASMRYDNARQQLDILQRSQATAEDAYALDWTRFLGGGNVTLLEVIDAYQQMETLKVARFEQEFAARQATALAALILGVSQ
jgi:outer membrane protein TolC